MAMRTGQAFTVRGSDHFYSKLRDFACTGVPILDAEGALVSTVSLVMIDRGNRADYLFGQQLLGTAAQRIQRKLFEKRFADSMLVTVSRTEHGDFLSGDGLVAVDEAGIILGATSAVPKLVGVGNARGLTGQAFQSVFDVESDVLARVPDRVLSMPIAKGPALSLSVRLPGTAKHWRAAAPVSDASSHRRRLPPSLRQLATGSPTMAAVCKQAAAVFSTGSPLLLEGETGTGKSALITALLEADSAKAPVYRIDCATLGDTLADHEHLKLVLGQARVLASLPDAERRRATLVFDNIDEMSRPAQAELRMLMDNFEAEQLLPAIAETADVPCVIAVSRRPLASAVCESGFRDDLYYMLSAARITLPPLRVREHPEILAQVLAAQIAGKPIEITPEAVAAIRAHDFPGNVRELRNAMERALMVADGDRITPVDLRSTSIIAECAGPGTGPATIASSPRLTYDERTLILDALAASRWNVSEAARKLGMGRATINRKIKRYGVVRPS